ncbi:Dynein regulatory complex subunit 2 [Boothiomyces macroporosus]|uniref:Dynein regulatory complex subunit 2 n=1 Tax=Boothiomyces macroporosus TaxID=261099 RepID=A0AAD5YAI7_9FUNG|nr:Dynein regulatory complex subunit 2 [Boothiomyces macroporosus]
MAKKGKKEKGNKSEFGIYKNEEERRKAMEEMKQKANEKRIAEEKIYRLNSLKIQNRWKEIMKQAKSIELKNQIEILRQIQSRRLDKKQTEIDNLKASMVQSEEQFTNALQSHLINIDTLIDLQNSRLETLITQFDDDLNALETEFNTERTMLQIQHAKERGDTLGIMMRAEHEFIENEADAKHEYSSVRDDVKNKNLEEKHALRIQLEGTVEDLWRQFQSALNQYNTSTDERKKQFEELKQKDQKNAKEIEQQMKKLVKLQENIAHLKTKMSNTAKDYEERNKALKEEKDAIQVQFQALKKRMNTFREEERHRLTELTLLSNSVIKALRVKVEKAEQIIKLAEMNRKLETEQEKICPFYEESPFESVPEVEIDIELPKEFHGMHQFNKRFNKVFLDKLALEKQYASLSEENSRLRAILKQYLDGITLSESVINELNPLIVVNGKTNAPLRQRGPVHVTYVEAAQCVASK